MTPTHPDPEARADEFRRVMKGFDLYLEQSPNPGALKNHIAGALKLNAQIHRLAALEEAANEALRGEGERK